MAGGSSSTIGGGGGGAIEGPPIDIETPTISDSELRYCPLYTGTAIHHNGITWNFSSNVTWGTYVSGDPWVLVTGAGITITSIEPGLTLVAGLAGTGAGITFWINGTVKNQKALKQNSFFGVYNNWYGITYQNYNNTNSDQRLVGRINGVDFTTATLASGFSYSELALTPIGLTSGDMLMSTYSSVDLNNNNFSGDTIRFTPISSQSQRTCIESRAVLSAVGTIPDCDEYRPPVYWIDGNSNTRPSFKESNIVNSPDNYVLDITEYRDLFGYTLSQPLQYSNGITYAGLVNSWNSSLEDSMISSIIPMWYTTRYQGHTDLRSVYGFNNRTSTYGGKIKANVLETNLYSIFAPWVPKYLRLKAQRRITQYAIDMYGCFKNGGRFQENGGHIQSIANPYVRLLGWMYNDAAILNYEKSGISFSETFISNNMTSGGSSPKGIINIDKIHKSLFLDEYMQHHFVYGLGETGAGKTAFIATNPNVGITHNFGLSGSGQNIFIANGATGIGWLYKYQGITLNSSDPYATVSNVSIQSINGLFNATGQFGVLNFSEQFKPRNKNTLPPSASALGKLNYDENQNYKGVILKITGGSGAGSTEYRILKANGFDIQGAGTTYSCSVILDRPFQDGYPSATSVVSIYPYSTNEQYPRNAGLQEGIFNRGITSPNFGNCPQMGYSTMSYAGQFLPHTFIAYSVMKLLGITQDNELVDYFYNLYFSDKYPTYAKHTQLGESSVYGLAFTSSYSTNNLKSMLIKNMWGASGSYIGILTNQSSGISGTAYPPLLSLVGPSVGSALNSYSYTAEQVSYTDEVTEETYQGIGKIFDTPQTSYYIKGFVGDNMFIDINQYSSNDYPDFTQLFGSPSLFINGIKTILSTSPFVLVDGKVNILHENAYIGPSEGTEVNYLLTDGSSYIQHSVSTVVPIGGSTAGTSTVTSTLSVSDISRRRDILTFTINPIGITSDYYDSDAAIGATSDDSLSINIQGDIGYINIAGNLNSVDDWKPVTIDKNLSTYTIDISEIPNKDLIGAPMTIRFFTDPINIFEYDMGTNNSIKYRQNTSVYSRY